MTALAKANINDGEIERRRGIGRRRNRYPRRLIHARRECLGVARESKLAAITLPLFRVLDAAMLGGFLLLFGLKPAQAQAVDYTNHGASCDTAYDSGDLAAGLPFTPKACGNLFPLVGPNYDSRRTATFMALAVAVLFARLAEACDMAEDFAGWGGGVEVGVNITAALASELMRRARVARRDALVFRPDYLPHSLQPHYVVQPATRTLHYGGSGAQLTQPEAATPLPRFIRSASPT
jgi:hypothetical protein